MNHVREPDQIHQKLDPNTCEIMAGEQHAVADVQQLAESIATLGQLNPVQLIQYADGRRLIAAGRRRWLACKELGLSLIANIWVCPEDEDINLELFARAVRIAENVERVDPSAIDIARQLKVIRNERGFKNASEVAAHLSMSSDRVKRYMSVLRASEHLQKAASQHSIGLTSLVELTKCESRLSAAAMRKLVDRVVRNELTKRDLIQLRTGRSPSPVRKPGKPRPSSLRSAGAKLETLAASASGDDVAYLAELVVTLRALLPEASSEAA